VQSTAESKESRDVLVREFAPLARRLATRYRHTTESLEDLMQVAYVGLVLAADRYDPSRGTSFPAYAIPTILGELRRHIRDHGWAVHVSRGLQENVLRLTSAKNEATRRLGRDPTPAEIGAEAGLDSDQVVEAMAAMGAYEAESLDHRIGVDDEWGAPMLATIGREEAGYELVEYCESMRPAMAELSDQEKALLAMRFFDDMTQSEIARRSGVSQMQVSRVLRRALERLHRATDTQAAA
jgi:RNA polymerase sigma-B factor